MRKTIVVGAVGALALAGCANLHDDYTPKMETSGRDPIQVADDISECQAIAYHRTNPSTLVTGVLTGAVAGAMALPAVATAGAVTGGAASGYLGPKGQYEFGSSRVAVTRGCLMERGYKLLD